MIKLLIGIYAVFVMLNFLIRIFEILVDNCRDSNKDVCYRCHEYHNNLKDFEEEKYCFLCYCRIKLEKILLKKYSKEKGDNNIEYGGFCEECGQYSYFLYEYEEKNYCRWCLKEINPDAVRHKDKSI